MDRTGCQIRSKQEWDFMLGLKESLNLCHKIQSFEKMLSICIPPAM